MVAGHHPVLGTDLGSLAVDLDPPTRDDTRLVIADLIRGAPIAGDAPAVLPLFGDTRHGALEDEVERDRLDVVGLEHRANQPQRLEDLVANGADVDGVRVGRQFATGPHRPLLGSACHTCVRVDDVAVDVLTETEPDLQRPVLGGRHQAHLLGPCVVGLCHRRERLHDLVVEVLVRCHEWPDRSAHRLLLRRPSSGIDAECGSGFGCLAGVPRFLDSEAKDRR